MLKHYFPAALHSVDTSSLIKAIVFYLVIGIIGGVICRVVGIIPIIGWLVAAALGLVVGIYTLVGIVLSILTYISINKK